MKVVKFKYYDEFHCIGPDCPETCCQQWDIHFSKKDYLKYKNLKCSPKLKEALNGCLVRNRADDADESSHYAKIKFNEKGYCSLLDENGLCMIHKELGENALGFVCATFPRLQAEIGNEAYVFSCEITCPHVVEILMNHPEGLEIVEEDYDGSSSFVNKGMFSSPCTSSLWSGYTYYWIIKSAQIDILQNRNFTIPERLLILGFFSKKADEYIANNQGEKIDNLYSMILNNEFCQSIVDSLKAPQSDESAAQKSIDLFSRQLYSVRHANKSALISKLFEQTAQSIDIDIQESEQNNQITFNYNMEKYFGNVGVFRGLELDRPYIFENILVNIVFISSPDQGIFKSFFNLAIFYNTLKIALPAFLNKEDGNWSDTDLALAISNSAKMILNTKIANLVSKVDFEAHNSFDLPHIAFLIN